MKEKDILIAARPDQSLQIYEALCDQQKLSFQFVSFKVIPKWLKTFLGNKKLTGVGRNATITYWGTFKHLAKRRFRFRFAKYWSDNDILVHKIKAILSRNHFKIIHFWPEHCGGGFIEKYQNEHPEVLVLADIHMPHPEVVFRDMFPVYNKYEIDIKNCDLTRLCKEQKNYVTNINHIIVPSTYVADTYKEIYPNKVYHIVPYGIRISDKYKKTYKQDVTSFVYVGVIALEKGCDLLFDIFKNNQSLQLHVYGTILDGQKQVFESYASIPNIHFHGFIPKSEIQKAIRDFDAGIHLSRFDAYSLAVGEIIGCGLPVVVSDKTGNKEEIEKYGLGIVTPLSIDRIEEAISNICNTEFYNQCIDNIDAYLQHGESSYGECMMNFYEKHINSN